MKKFNTIFASAFIFIPIVHLQNFDAAGKSGMG